MMQSAGLNDGRVHPVGVPPAGPMSIALHNVGPWSNTQLCPPPVTGSAGLLCSKTELSGTKPLAVRVYLELRSAFLASCVASLDNVKKIFCDSTSVCITQFNTIVLRCCALVP